MMFTGRPDFPIALAFSLGALIGAALGLGNGLLVTLFHLPAIIVTLGTMSLYRGLVFIVSGGRQIDPNHVPEALIRFSQTSPLGLPAVVLLALSIVILTHLFMRFSRAGREIYATGSNVDAARLRGINVRLLTVLVFVLSGLLAGIAGIMYASRFGYVNPAITGVGMELTVIAAVVIGGTSITGGTGTVLGTTLGCLLLGIISTSLPILGVSGTWQQAIYGAIIVLALVIDRVVLSTAAKRGGAR
jgi:rhamnose transport system permease protein